MKTKIIALLACLMTLLPVFGQIELNDALSRGDVTLTARGAGASTGLGAVTGNLRNNTAREIQVNVIIRDGLYLVNSGRGQNMIALQVFQSGGRFWTLDGRRFITLPANSNTAIEFTALCAEFDMDNPTNAEIFRTAAMPQQVRAILSRINNYLARNFDANLSNAAQIALWRTHDLSRGRGLTRQEIATTFPVSDADWAASTRIMNYGVNQPQAAQLTVNRATNQATQPARNNNPEEGVVINGVRWATRNVAAPGTFAARPEDAGQFFQWNRRQGWSAIGTNVSGWNATLPTGTFWTSANNPCPQGWRVPTEDELRRLGGSTWTSRNGVNGRLFGSAPNQIFLPASGFRGGSDGSLHGVGEYGIYWSGEQANSDYAWSLLFGSRDGDPGVGRLWRQNGLSLRCVADETTSSAPRQPQAAQPATSRTNTRQVFHEGLVCAAFYSRETGVVVNLYTVAGVPPRGRIILLTIESNGNISKTVVNGNYFWYTDFTFVRRNDENSNVVRDQHGNLWLVFNTIAQNGRMQFLLVYGEAIEWEGLTVYVAMEIINIR